MRESDLDYSARCFGKLHNQVVDIRARDVIYMLLMLLHNKLLVQGRLYRVRLKPESYCLYCPGAEIGNAEHFSVPVRKLLKPGHGLKDR